MCKNNHDKNKYTKVISRLQKDKFAPLKHLPFRHIGVLRELLCRCGYDEPWLATIDTTLHLGNFDFEMESQI